MKKILTYLSFSFMLFSCDIDKMLPDAGGVTFVLLNATNNNYENAKIYIGALKNGVFIKTDSILVPTIVSNENGTIFINGIKYARTVAIPPFSEHWNDGSGWLPNLNKINIISDKGTFLLQLSKDRKLFFYDFNFPRSKYFNDASITLYIDQDVIRERK